MTPVPVHLPLRGEIWLVRTPGIPDDPHQPRPGLVVSSDVRNQLRNSVIVVPIFSAGRLGPARVRMRAGQGGLPHDSVAFCDEITTLRRDFLRGGPLGAPVPDRLMHEVLKAIRRALGETVPP